MATESGTERREIRLIQEEDGWWSAVDEETGVASQGETREVALDNLDEAVKLTLEAREAARRRPNRTHPGSIRERSAA
jgi:predicted RNase H-like HicB family nuclease